MFFFFVNFFFSALISNAGINLFGDNFNFLAEMTIGAEFLYFIVETCLQCRLSEVPVSFTSLFMVSGSIT